MTNEKRPDAGKTPPATDCETPKKREKPRPPKPLPDELAKDGGGEGPDSIRERAEWFRKRSGGKRPPR